MKKGKINTQILYALVGLSHLWKITDADTKNIWTYPYWKFELLVHYIIQAHQPKDREYLFRIFPIFEIGKYGWVCPENKKEKNFKKIFYPGITFHEEAITSFPLLLKDEIEEPLDTKAVDLIKLGVENIIKNKPSFMTYTEADHAVFSLNSATYGFFRYTPGRIVDVLESEYREDFLNEYSPLR